MRVIGDITPNHTGNSHEWFLAAQDDPDAPERGFYYFDDSLPHGYAAWWGIRHLPKLNHSSPELGRRLAAIVQKWMREPYCLDGWRVDVANMTGRLAGVDLGHEVARRIRAAALAVNPEALVVAEHAHDFRADLQGGGWQGTMNYAGFMRPAWQWLHGDLPDELRNSFWGFPVGLPTVDGAQATATMRAFRAGVPWPSTLHSWVLLDSHDSARWATVAGSRERQLVGIGLQMTMPGVPMVYAGDEVGLEGAWGEDARRTMPWDGSDGDGLFGAYRDLIALRRGSPALARGGIRYAAVTPEAVAYLREHEDERLLCLATRSPREGIRLALDAARRTPCMAMT
jgi:alpha-glucosidase